MDNLFGIILFLIFVLAPIIEQIRKKQQKQQPPTRQPPSRLPQSRTPELPQPRSHTEEVSGKERDAASVLIPDDLWQILTGEARPPVLTTPPQQIPRRKPIETVYIPPEEAEDEEAAPAEDVNIEVARTSREAVQREHARRHKPVEARSLEVEPEIISLETGAPSGAARHSAFHDKLLKTAQVATKARKQSLLNMSDVREVRRAFILQEVLGRPRGLE